MKGFDFEVICKNGKDNVVANALSIIEEALSLYSIIFHSCVVGRSLS
jgi:hypothetical protein